MPRRITKLPLLYLSFVQCYLEPGSTYQFSHHFQGVLANRLTRTMRASQELSDRFPGVQKVSFWISAGKILPKKTVRVQLHNKRKHEVEIFVVIPYSWTRRPKLERHQRAVSSLIDIIATFFEGFEIDTKEFRSREGPLLAELASNTERYFDDYYASLVGKTKDGRQFFITQPFVPGGHDFVARYLFDKDGAFLDAKIHDLGSRDSDVVPGNALMDNHMVARLQKEMLEELGDTKFGDIKVSPFVHKWNGVNFGLVTQAPEEEDDEWNVIAEPGDYMAFYPPWDGDYDT